MTSKLKCPWCGSEIMYSVLGQNLTSSHFCDNKDCKAFQMVLPDYLWKDIFAWKQSQKYLEIARKSLDWLGNNRLAENHVRVEQLRRYARNTLEQITDDSSEKANSGEHKDGNNE